MSETNAQTKTSDQGLLAAGFFVGLTPLYYAKINSWLATSRNDEVMRKIGRTAIDAALNDGSVC